MATLREGAAKERQRAVISFGPEHAPLEQKQVEMALEEARKLVPRPQLIVFAAFQFDPEAAKDIDETNWPGDDSQGADERGFAHGGSEEEADEQRKFLAHRPAGRDAPQIQEETEGRKGQVGTGK